MVPNKVGRTPWSAPDPLVGLPAHRVFHALPVAVPLHAGFIRESTAIDPLTAHSFQCFGVRQIFGPASRALVGDQCFPADIKDGDVPIKPVAPRLLARVSR
jgi:hypothetical protein